MPVVPRVSFLLYEPKLRQSFALFYRAIQDLKNLVSVFLTLSLHNGLFAIFTQDLAYSFMLEKIAEQEHLITTYLCFCFVFL